MMLTLILVAMIAQENVDSKKETTKPAAEAVEPWGPPEGWIVHPYWHYPKPGEELYLGEFHKTPDVIYAAPKREDFHAMAVALGANDTEGLAGLKEAGKIIQIEKPCRVRVLEFLMVNLNSEGAQATDQRGYSVRFIEGPHKGKVVYAQEYQLNEMISPAAREEIARRVERGNNPEPEAPKPAIDPATLTPADRQKMELQRTLEKRKERRAKAKDALKPAVEGFIDTPKKKR